MSTTDNTSQSPRHLQVFLASPGDVADERGLALTVLEQLQYDPLLRGRITVETVAWDKLIYLVDLINQICKFDVCKFLR